MMAALSQGEIGIERMCRLAGLSRAGYYRHLAEKEPEKGDTRVVDPKVIQQIWQDFARYREP